MENIKSIIAKNITDLRCSRSMTQLELAEKLHYSDKAVSKWERGESVPEINTLIAIADLFEVPLDDLVREPHSKPQKTSAAKTKNKDRLHARAIITSMSVLIIWFVAMLVYVLIEIISSGKIHNHWLAFVYAVPASLIIWLIFNAIWFNRRRNYLIISLLVWATLGALHVTFLPFGFNIWPIYAIGIPAELFIILWSHLWSKKPPKR